MNVTPRYHAPLIQSAHHQFHPEQLNPAIDTFTAGKYLSAFNQTLNLIKSGTVPDNTMGSVDVHVPNGSIVLHIKADEQRYTITAPFLRLGEKGAVGLLRQVAEINMEALTLAQIELRDRELYFVYSAPMALSHPQKVYAILHEMCFKSDYYDDVFIEKLHAVPLNVAKHHYANESQQQAAWDTYTAIINEALAYIEYTDQKRRLDLAMCVMCSALMSIDYCLQPQGFFRSELERIINGMFDRGPQLSELVQRTKTSLKKLLELSRDKFNQGLYVPEFFIPIKTLLDEAATRSKVQGFHEQYKKSMANTDYLETALGITWQLYRLIYYYDLPNAMQQQMVQALTQAANQPWQEAANRLLQCLNELSKD